MPIPKDYVTPARISAKEKAFQQLQRWIIDGTLEPGEKLYDIELAEALGISRTPVREALQLLQIRGFIEMHPGKETRVTAIQRDDVLKMYPPLASLQALAAEEAVKNIVPGHIEALKEINMRYEQAIHNGQVFTAMEIDEEFHNLIVEIADNPYILDFSSLLQMHLRRLKYVFLKQHTASNTDSLKEHERVIQALAGGDGEAASAAMKQNWLRPMREVYELLL
ncbi:GntR family transcriptional regulator [Aneurinibacillus danicus]|uniref:GntR family transcriptional regulator n=1 Tax=Aneurinibacillus danicus TaxID=267746 RepID=A0A511V3T4_9BACL|nr:GntR family transcriptional regulator [Aneurinibacillus danicus]GEN33576.1 GntR family transcriptional regulator [Aneurinibacillus danicus]